MSEDNLCFEPIDWNSLQGTLNDNSNDDFNLNTNTSDTTDTFSIYNTFNTANEYDKTTMETYRVRRLFKIDPLTDQEVQENMAFKFEYNWDPYSGLRNTTDPVGPLYFNAITLYNHYFLNRYKGLWNPPQDQYQGYYGDLIGTGKKIKITSRGNNPERYLYRLPIIDCYLPPTHKNSVITMGPELTEDEVLQIDVIVSQHHPSRSHSNFVSLSTLKYYYDNALEISPDPECTEIKNLVKKFPNLTTREINEKYNRMWVDKLVKLKY